MITKLTLNVTLSLLSVGTNLAIDTDMSGKVYWTMKNGQKIDVDKMDINHLRNTLKMIIRNVEAKPVKKQRSFQLNGDIAQMHNDLMLIDALEPEYTGNITDPMQ